MYYSFIHSSHRCYLDVIVKIKGFEMKKIHYDSFKTVVSYIR